MSRLLFAAARGAVLQREIEKVDGGFHWVNIALQWGMDDELRIHPDDEHLQYGPISTALRQGANQYGGGNQPSGLGRMLCIPFVEHHRRGGGKIDNELHRSIFLLILAEALADEGL